MIQRFWQIDAVRGFAVGMMIIFHFLYDLVFFRSFDIVLSSGAWLVFGRATAVIFLFLVGFSLSLSYNRIRNRLSSSQVTIKYLKRGVMVFFLGLIVTAATLLLFPEAFIFFGVLHLLGIAIILARPLLSKTYLNLFLGLLIVVIGMILTTMSFSFAELSWLGLQPAGLYTFDYFPLLPWLGVVLLGLFAGNISKFFDRKPAETENLAAKGLAFIGRHSLIIYFLHQPILIGLILLL